LGDLEVDKVSKMKVFEILQISSIEEMLREKRLKWFGHLAGQEEGDVARKSMLYRQHRSGGNNC